jgi:nicotinamide-nucleotide amidase
MAHGALKTFKTTWAIATTGVAGPDSSDGVAAGTVWVAIAGPVTQSIQLALDGERENIRSGTVASAIGTFARILRASNLALFVMLHVMLVSPLVIFQR